mmetsp:Transcript_6426/g.14272  ORF Transcript_6426/g.14272 Transcript_6426/m.14272 type:complete len:114 (+) Transcript_6426:1045-1386(+)
MGRWGERRSALASRLMRQRHVSGDAFASLTQHQRKNNFNVAKNRNALVHAIQFVLQKRVYSPPIAMAQPKTQEKNRVAPIILQLAPHSLLLHITTNPLPTKHIPNSFPDNSPH